MAIAKDKAESLARTFLKTGRIGDIDQSALAAACDRLIRMETEKSSATAVRLAGSFVRHATSQDRQMLLTAYRALGWASLVAGQYRGAEQAYLKARKLARNEAEIRARIDRALIDAYMYLGKFGEARRRARMSLATLRRLGARAEIAKTQVNYANLLHRQDKHREAGKLYRQAGEYFEKKGIELAAAFCYYNEANTLVQLFDFDRATELYTRAKEIFLRHGHDLRANGCLYGLAWLHMLEGDYHIALRELEECEREYRKASQPREVVLCQLDRAESYLGLNLFTDARIAARDAENQAKKLGIRYEAAKAALFFAKASAAIGKEQGARVSLQRAAHGFKKDQNRAFLGAVKLVDAQLETERAARSRKLTLARRQFTRVQLPLWEAVCDLQYMSEHPDDAGTLRRLTSNPAVRTVPHLYARHNTMLGDRDASKGRLKSAVQHWQRAADVLDAVRAKLPPVDMRSSFARQDAGPYDRLVNASLPGDPATAAAWSERHKTAGLWVTPEDAFLSNPARRKAEESLSELAAQVTALSRQLTNSASLRGKRGSEANQALARLQRRVRQNLAALEEKRDARADRIDEICDEIAKASSRQTAVQFHIGSEDIVAFVHNRGITRFHRYADGARQLHELVSRWRFLLERAPQLGDRPSKSDLNDETELLRYMGQWLWEPLGIAEGERRVLIVPDGELASVPFPALEVNGVPLAERNELVISPSLRHHLAAAQKRSRSKHVEIFVGDSDGSLALEREYSALQDVAGHDIRVHKPCMRADWPDSGRARVWHYAGHAELRVDNPFYSSLRLADGPMFAADFRLKKNQVDLVTLSACRTGEQAHPPGEEATGFVRSMLEMGARNVIASQWAVYDRSTVSWMSIFYRYFLGGMPVSRAASEATLEVRESFPLAYHWAAFSVFGAG
ncbi:MAG: CHAT domain-containing protein [Candidatus Zixiibacteriota bacterium]|jgi:tetratricopeptide (TPR) repeat protein